MVDIIPSRWMKDYLKKVNRQLEVIYEKSKELKLW